MTNSIFYIGFIVMFFYFGQTFAAHFRGGMISWYPATNEPSVMNSTRTIMIKQRYAWSKSAAASACTAANILSATLIGEATVSVVKCYSPVIRCQQSNYISDISIYVPCTDFNNIIGMSYGHSTTAVNLTVQPYGIVLGYAVTAAWLILQMGVGGWSLMTMIDLRPREDNQLINSSPESTISPVIYVPAAAALPTSIDIPMSDVDGDIIECRFALVSNVLANVTVNECDDVCQPLALPASTQLISGNNTCTLIVTLPTIGYYAVAVQLEDFLENSTEPLSSVPLQFLLLTYDASNPSSTCTTPPVITSIPPNYPAPESTVVVQVTVLYTAMVIARSGCENDTDTSITNFITTSPSGMLKTNLPFSLPSYNYAINLTWAPSLNQLGQTFRFCATAVDSNYYTSSQYCFFFYVGPKTSTTTTTSTTSTSTTTTTTTTSTTSTTSTSTTSTTTTSTTSTTTTTTSTTSDTTTTTTSTTGSTSTVTPYNYLPLVFGLGLGLGLPLLLLLTLLPLLCLCRLCWNPFLRGHLKQCPHCKKSISFEENVEETEQSRIKSADSELQTRVTEPLSLPQGMENYDSPPSDLCLSRSLSPFDRSCSSIRLSSSLMSPSKESTLMENFESGSSIPLTRPSSSSRGPGSILVRAYSRQIQPL